MKTGSPALLVLLSLVSFLFPTRLHSQAVPAVGASMAQRFQAIAWDGVIDDIYFVNDKTAVRMAIYGHVRSAIYSYLGVGSILFLRDRKGDDGKVVQDVVGQADLSSGGEKPLLLFFADGKNPGKYLIQVVPDDQKSFPLGSYKVVNTTNKQILLQLAATEKQLRPKETALLSPKPRTVVGVPDMLDVHVYTQEGNQREQVFGSIWSFQKKLRTMLFIVQPPGEFSRVETKRLVDDPNFVPLTPKPGSAPPAAPPAPAPAP